MRSVCIQVNLLVIIIPHEGSNLVHILEFRELSLRGRHTMGNKKIEYFPNQENSYSCLTPLAIIYPFVHKRFTV